jgi:hypothetical protein
MQFLSEVVYVSPSFHVKFIFQNMFSIQVGRMHIECPLDIAIPDMHI